MKNWMKIFLRSLICLSLTLGTFTSCLDDVWEKIDEMDQRLDVLEAELTSQAEALNSLLTNGATLTSCIMNADGSYTVTLSNGTRFKVLPAGADFSALLTYTVVDGVKCWATYGPDGKPVVLTDSAGKPIPVNTSVSVKIKDGVYYLVINGKEYETGYDAGDVVQVFSSCTPLTDASGNVYAVKFTFGEGMEITVALDGYKGVVFKMSSLNNTVVSEYFIHNGETQSFLMEMTGVVDYVPQVPDGWRVKEYTEDLTGETFLTVTAPSKELVAMGAAVSEGWLKVLSVVEGGRAAVSKMYLSTDPFKTYDVTSVKAVIEPYYGVQKFAYGMMFTDDFDAVQVCTTVGELLTSSDDLPEGYYISSTPVDKFVSEIFPGEMPVDRSYTFWALPILYSEDNDEGFYVNGEMIRTKVLAPITANVQISNETVLDADVKVTIEGTPAVYAGVSEVTESYLDEIVYQINNGIIEPGTEALSYEGPASAFPTEEAGSALQPGTGYALWIVPVVDGKDTYSKADIIVNGFSTKSIVSGGTIKTDVSDFEITASSLKAQVSSEDAAIIYYTFMSGEDGQRYSTASNETKMGKILGSETYVETRGNAVEAVAKGLRPETTNWLYAVAVGNDGKYGDVVCESATTGSVSFNSLSLELESLGVGSDEASFKVIVSGGTATDYIYWAGLVNDPFWKSEEFCGNSRTSAQEYLAANPDAPQVQKVMNRNGKVSEDGVIELSELSMSAEYVFIILAQDESGRYSRAAYKKFTTLAADLGVIVREGTDTWKNAMNQTSIEWIQSSFIAPENSNMSANYSFKITCPVDLTAFILCGSDTYFDGMNLVSSEERIVYIENYTSRNYDNGYVPYKDGEMMTEPDYYKNGELHKGQLMNVYDYYVHGLPQLGFATYHAAGDHDGNCIYWEGDMCEAYERALNKIAEHKTITPYQQRAEIFGLKGAEAETWAKALLEAYLPFYENAEPIIYYNDGAALKIGNPYAIGVNEDGEVADRVIVVYRDKDGNYYEPMYFEVPNYFN